MRAIGETLLPSGYWQDLTSADLRAVCVPRTIAVLPVAAVEQHGPHLPLGTDALINDGVLRRCMQQVRSDLSHAGVAGDERRRQP